MNRQSIATNKSVGTSKSNQVLNTPFAIFQGNQQKNQDQKQRQSILIRTLPFIKRKKSEEYNTNDGDAKDLQTPQNIEYNQNKEQQLRSSFQKQGKHSTRQSVNYPIDSSNQNKQQIKYFVHNVGNNLGKTPQHYSIQHSQSAKNLGRGIRFSTDTPQQQQTFSQFAFMTYSQLQSPAQTPQSQQYNNNFEKFSSYHPKNMTSGFKQYQYDQSNDQTPQDSMYNSQMSQDPQKKFFENFMQEAKPKFPNDLPVLNDSQIKEDYLFQYKAEIEKQENLNSSIAFINGFPHNFPLLEGHYQAAFKLRGDLGELKIELRKEIELVKQKFDSQAGDFKKEAMLYAQKIQKQIQEDFVKHQTDQFALNKEITKLQRDKNIIETDIEKSLQIIRELEHRLFGQEVFDLVPKDPYIQNISTQNQRSDVNTPMSTKRQSQIIKNMIH